MPQRLFTIQRGQKAQNIIEAAGSVIAGGNSDAISVNVDFTNMSRQDFVQLVREVQERALEGAWPPV